MVAPLIVGAARVLGGKKLAARAAAKVERPGLVRKIQRREKIANLQDNPLQTEESKRIAHSGSARLRKARMLNAVLPSQMREGIRKINAYTACITIFWTAIPFWFAQFFFWIVGLFGFGTEIVPLVNYVFDGRLIFGLTLVLIGVIGLVTMIYGAIFLWVRNVDCVVGAKGFIFIVCISLYFAPFINLFPWFILWLFAVVKLQTEEEK